MTETQNTSRRPGALIAMSGGVDSSVAAWLMQRDGFDCTGVTMRLTRNEAVNTEGLHTCCSERDIEDAAEVAYAMDIPYEVLDFTADFQEKIIDKFIRVYEAGGTPNPCIDCNRYMKFDHLLRFCPAKQVNDLHISLHRLQQTYEVRSPASPGKSGRAGTRGHGALSPG